VDALAPGDVEIAFGRLLPDSGWFAVDSIEAAGPATRLGQPVKRVLAF